MKIIYLLFVALSIFSCNRETTNTPREEKIIATIDSLPVYESEIDSLIDKKIYEIKREALQFVIDKKILLARAKQLNISLDSLMKQESAKQSLEVSNADFKRYVKDYNIDTRQKRATDIISQIKQIKKQEQRQEYINRLKEKHTVSVFLRPNFFPTINLDSVLSYNLNEPKPENSTVYIISDYECSTCQKAEPSIENIIAKYKEEVNFKYVYHGSYVGKAILASNAAYKQGKFAEMHTWLFKHSDKLNDENAILVYAKELGLDMQQFKNDMLDKLVIKLHSLNRKELLKLGICSTPTFVVNNKLIGADGSITFLESVITEEIQKHKNQ